MPRRPRAASPATIPTNQSGIRPVVPVLDIVLPLESIVAVLKIFWSIRHPMHAEEDGPWALGQKECSYEPCLTS